jgi:tetratricopeptide (TPR) repeat protein
MSSTPSCAISGAVRERRPRQSRPVVCAGRCSRCSRQRVTRLHGLYALSYCCYYVGDFASSLEAATRLDALGEATGSRRARAEAAMAGLSYAARGDWEAGIDASRRALEHAPDPFERTEQLPPKLGAGLSQ